MIAILLPSSLPLSVLVTDRMKGHFLSRGTTSDQSPVFGRVRLRLRGKGRGGSLRLGNPLYDWSHDGGNEDNQPDEREEAVVNYAQGQGELSDDERELSSRDKPRTKEIRALAAPHSQKNL